MKRKKVILLLAAAAVAAAIFGCAKKPTEPTEATQAGEDSESAGSEVEETEEVSPTEQPETETGDTQTESEEDPGVSQAARDELWAILTSVRDDVQPGTAGSSLKADAAAVSLLQWGVKESMSPEDAKEITEEFCQLQSNGFYAEAIEVVDFACKELQGADAASILDTIGMDLSDKTWGDTPLPLVEAVMEASGLR